MTKTLQQEESFLVVEIGMYQHINTLNLDAVNTDNNNSVDEASLVS